MSKAAQIRAALADGLLTTEQLAEKIGWTPNLSPSQYAADFAWQMKDGVKHWALKSMMVRVPKSSRPRRLKGFRAEARERAAAKKALKKVVRNALQRPLKPAPAAASTDATRGAVAVFHTLIDAIDVLCTAVETQVEDVEKDRMLSSAVAFARRTANRFVVAQS